MKVRLNEMYSHLCTVELKQAMFQQCMQYSECSFIRRGAVSVFVQVR